MSDPLDRTVDQLRAWHEGDSKALDKLLRDNLGWMRGYVRRELSPAHRQRVDSIDIVQDALVRVLQASPGRAPETREEFRALISKILKGALNDQRDHDQAQKRDLARDQRMPSQGLSRFSPLGMAARAPDSIVQAREERSQILEAVERLSQEDAAVFRLRQMEGCSFDQIAEKLDLKSADAARMRYHRALPRLARILETLRISGNDAEESPGD